MTRVRFAPSPTGFVHVGNARTAIFNFLFAKKGNGQYILRIEDTDKERSRRDYETQLIKDLKWLGIKWDEYPDSGGKYGPYRQSERLTLYKEHYLKLIEGDKAYYCFCTEEELEAEKNIAKEKGENLIYSGKCSGLDPELSKERVKNGEKAAIRFRTPIGNDIRFNDMVRGEVSMDPSLIGDMIIVRSNGIPAYNFAVVIDDHMMEIDFVIRGEDHLSNTFRQVLLYDAFGFAIPEFAHLSMVMGEDNAKLSKRHGSVSIGEFREKGYLPEALFNYLALLGWSPGNNQEIFQKGELINSFDIKRVTKSSAIFDYTKLNWVNREHIRLLESAELAKRISPFLKKEGFSCENTPTAHDWVGNTSRVLSNYEHTLEGIAFLFEQFYSDNITLKMKKDLLGSESSRTVLSSLYESLTVLESPVSFEKTLEIIKEIQKKTGIKGKELYHPIRLALTGKESGIELKDLIPVIEEGSVLSTNPRISNMKERLEFLF